MNPMYEEFYDDLVIKRIGNQWCFDKIEDQPLSRRQMWRLLTSFNISIEEIAFMLLEFNENPKYTKAYFGINGYFLYCE